jgi:phosphohistidine phosphatase
MYIGHNPGLEELARRLVRKPVDAAETKRTAAMEKKFPTSAVAVIDFDVKGWSEIDAASGTLSDFLAPADLKGG